MKATEFFDEFGSGLSLSTNALIFIFVIGASCSGLVNFYSRKVVGALLIFFIRDGLLVTMILEGRFTGASISLSALSLNALW